MPDSDTQTPPRIDPNSATPVRVPDHPEWCVRKECTVYRQDGKVFDGDGWVGFHSTTPVELDFGEFGDAEVAVTQFRSGYESTGAPVEPLRLRFIVGDFTHPDAAQAAELARVLTEHAELMVRLTAG
jgi:hypothetical protein